MTDDADREQPVLEVITPDATPEQVAAVIAVFSAMSDGEEQPAPKSEWASPARRMRQALRPGAGGWRASALPH